MAGKNGILTFIDLPIYAGNRGGFEVVSAVLNDRDRVREIMRGKLFLIAAFLIFTGSFILVLSGVTMENKNKPINSPATTPADYQLVEFNTIHGEKTSLADFRGKTLLLVNVASKCGHTPQYGDLEKLYREYKGRGLVVIGFPANNFGGQEPGSDKEIYGFCTTEFDVTFPMMAKISVTGDDKHPLYIYLTENSPVPGEIKWNFTKFLLDRDGHPVARYDSATKPYDPDLIKKIESLL